VLELESDIAAARGLSTAPAGTWPATTDPRVRAIIALAPWNAPLLDHSGITRPTLILVGSADDVTVPERDAYASFAALRAPATLVTFDHAGHYLFVDECPPVLLQFDAFSACSDPVWDMARAHDLSRHLITAFLRAHLQQDTAAAAALLPEQVSYPGVTYQVEAAGP
jgi:predicted dienelactone hydrolase